MHDSPDYYQLKLSVFNDDKRTELIGEAWIDLRDIIVPGGGQADQWQSLNCKGKYAGEIRIEVTYYDNKPKPDKPVAKAKPMTSGSEHDGPAPRTPVKRRPLPTNPGSTEPSPAAKARVDLVQTPPRAQPQPHGNFIPTQSPLQAMEYNTPPLARLRQPEPASAPEHNDRFATPPSIRDDTQYRRSMDRNDKVAALEEDRGFDQDQFSRSLGYDQRGAYPQSQTSYEQTAPAVLGPRQLGGAAQEDDRPPPPPAHRVRNNSATTYDMSSSIQHKVAPPASIRHDVLRNEAHRHSVQVVPSPASSSNYPGRPIYRPYDSAPEMPKLLSYEDPNHSSPSRHHSYDSAYDPHPRSMQATVEDVPESWTPPVARSRHSSIVQEQYDEMRYGSVPSPAPLNLSGRGSAASGNFATPSPVQRPYGANNLGPSPSPVASRDYYDERPGSSHADSHISGSDLYSGYASGSEGTFVHRALDYDMPPVPPTLVPGIDAALSQEIATRFHEDRRQERRYVPPAGVIAPTRGRQQHNEPPVGYGAQPSPHSYSHMDPRGYGASYSTGPSTPSGPPMNIDRRGHSPSPNPSHTIKRKSVSPAPPQEERQEGRRLSAVPFGPDSYDELNPSVVSVKGDPKNGEYTNSYGKIVTADGREVDPSDHLPMDTWAPEPEPKQPKGDATSSSRPSLASTQSIPPSGRRQIRIAARPQSMATLPTTYMTSEVEPSPPPSAGRNRLQKKSHRISAMPTLPAPSSSPLGPAMSHQRNSTPPMALVRAGTFDYENHGPPYGAPRGAYSGGPPIPAKVPLMSGGLGPSGGGGGQDEWALMDEMSRIDLGSGRSRRRGGY